jgi:hypothetical protein
MSEKRGARLRPRFGSASGRFKRLAATVAIVGLVSVGLGVGSAVVGPPTAAVAANPGLFNPGLIISDALFYDGGAMTVDQIQSFLNSQEPNCANGYTCLKSYSQATTNKALSSGKCAAYNGMASETAAQIIYNVGAVCGISQKVLLVTLEKEEGLVRSQAPSSSAYTIAMGYGCPDTAACDTDYYGFFNQVYLAAKQFKTYFTSPGSFGYQAGVANQILYSPNRSCGSSTVVIQNKATAGLYDYTPYQPDAAAIANLYGVGDGCSSYGNRNFWALYTDWFGSTMAGTSLLKSSTSPDIYLVAGTFKYYIRDGNMLGALSPLGAVAVVSQSVLDYYTNAGPAGYVISGTQGDIYFYDAGVRYPLYTCDLVADYGASCNPGGTMQLTDYQMSQLKTGAPLQNLLATTAGALYQVSGDVRHEILDAASESAAGISGTPITVTEASAGSLTTGAPIVRDSVFVKDRDTGTYAFLDSAGVHAMTAQVASSIGVTTRTAGTLNDASLALLPQSSAFTGIVSTGGITYVLAANGRFSWSTGAGGLSAPLAVSPVVVASYPDLGTVQAGSLIESPGSYTIYQVTPTSLRWVTSWAMVTGLSTGPAVDPLPVPSSVANSLPLGQPILTAGFMMKTATDPMVYLVDGSDTRIPVYDFATSGAAGISSNYWIVSDDQLNAYPATADPLQYGITCGSKSYISAQGALHYVAPSMSALYPIGFTTLQSTSCASIPIGIAATQFIRSPDGTIYDLSGGQKHWVRTQVRLVQLGGTTIAQLNVTQALAALIPTGPDA